jgi:hypothetical protein
MDLLSEFALRVGPVHGLLGAGLVALLRLFRSLFVPGGRFVPITFARNGVPQLLQCAELLFPEAPVDSPAYSTS